MGDLALAGEDEVSQLLSVEREEQRLAKLVVEDDRRVSVHELGIDGRPVLREDFHVPVFPLIARLEGDVQRQSLPKREVSPGQHIGQQGVVIADEADFDLIDLGPTERGTVPCLHDQVAVLHPIPHAEQARAHEF